MVRLNSPVYVLGKIHGPGYCEDTKSGTLYSKGRYKTSIKESDLPDTYIKCHARVFHYAYGYIKTDGVKDIAYTYMKENHVFKDDYLYLSYDEPLKPVYSRWGNIYDYENGICLDGNDIIRVLLAVEKNSPNVDTSQVRKLIDEKIEYLRTYEQPYYESCFDTLEKIDIYELYGDREPDNGL